MKIRRLFLPRYRRRSLANLDLAMSSVPGMERPATATTASRPLPVVAGPLRAVVASPSSLPAPDRQRPRPEPPGSPHRPVRVLDLEADVAHTVHGGRP